jgi:hypothetical protein
MDVDSGEINSIKIKRFSSVVVVDCIDKAPSDRPDSLWACKCNCGDAFIARRDELVSGEVTHCGCLGWLERGKSLNHKRCL